VRKTLRTMMRRREKHDTHLLTDCGLPACYRGAARSQWLHDLGLNQMAIEIGRRNFITLVAGGAIVWPFATTRAQNSGKLPRIGILWHAASAEEEAVYLGAIRDGLRDIGYVEGKNIALENRFPAEQPERFFALAAELAALKVDVLVAVTRLAAVAAQRATKTIPIVFVVVPDPVEGKLVSSISRPDGNITGLSNMAVELSAKRMELFRETIVNLTSVAVLVNPVDQEFVRRYVATMQTAAGPVSLKTVDAKTPSDIDRAFAEISKSGANGVVLAVDPLFFNERARIAKLAIEFRLPTIAYNGEYVEAGLLMSYGPDYIAVMRRVSYYVDKLLKGATPGDLPVEQPTKFEFAMNLKTAKALGVTIPPFLLSRTDKVFE
jgi:putative ABC transport system substrate-binding protein